MTTMSTGVANRRWRSVSSQPGSGGRAAFSHRVTRRWRALYQFMNTDTARPMVR